MARSYGGFMIITKSYGKNPLPTDVKPGEESRRPFTEEQLFILEMVNSYYGRFSAWPLRDMSHVDFPGDFNSSARIPIKDSEIAAKFAEHKIVRKLAETFPDA